MDKQTALNHLVVLYRASREANLKAQEHEMIVKSAQALEEFFKQLEDKKEEPS